MSASLREQLAAVAGVRWRLTINSLRSVRGRVNLVSRTIAGLLVTGAAIGGAVALGATAWELTRSGQLRWLGILFWVVALFWQTFPVMATAVTQNIDSSALLRFPMSYPGYFLVRMIFGALDIATALGLCWSVGLFTGISIAAPALLPWALITVSVFIVFNLLLARAIFVWIEHWLSRRRSREVIGVVFLAVMVGLQFIGPALNNYSKESPAVRFHFLAKFAPIERALPPGLTGVLLGNAEGRNARGALLALAAMLAYSAVAFWLLHLRLQQQYRGEDPAGTSAPNAVVTESGRHQSWNLPFLPASVAAVLEKELRYFSRSGPMLFTIVMPLIVIVLLWGGRKGFLAHQSMFFFPIGAAYCLLVMTNIVYNSFGGDGGGIQCFLMSPVSFKEIVLGKNLAQFTVLALEILVLWTGVSIIYQPPTPTFLALTLTWYLFAGPLNFGVGNVLSIYSPKRIDYAVFGRQRASESTIFASLAVQLAAMGIGAGAMLIGYRYSDYWISTLILALLAIPSIAAYTVLMSRLDRLVMSRREVLASELCRA